MLRVFVSSFVVCVLFFQVTLFAQQPSAPVAGQVHNHAVHGPHGGDLLEIGKEEFHAELVIDETKKQLAIFLMDSKVKDFVALDATFLAVNLKMAGKPVQIKLKPMPQEIDKPGFASRFGITSKELLDALHGGHADAKLALKIGSKSYTVKLVHDHDHAGHNHAPAVKK